MTDYFSIPAASASFLRAMHTSTPWHAKHRHVEPTAAMINGTAIHGFLLENKPLESCYHIGPDPGERGKRGGIWQAYCKEFEAAGGNRDELLTPAEFQEKTAGLVALKERFLSIPAISRLMQGAECERPFFAEIDGGPVKGKLDIINPGLGIIADIKTIANATDHAIHKTVRLHRGGDALAIQAALYCQLAAANGIQVDAFLWIFIESSTNLIRLVECSQDLLCAAHDLNQSLLATWRECNATGVWPAYGGEILTIDESGMDC